VGLFGILRRRRGSPQAVHAALGLAQWVCVLASGSLSIFDKVYAITRLPQATQRRQVDEGILQELIVFVAVLPLIHADMGRSFDRLLVATDVAEDFGFGFSLHRCGPDLAAAVGRLAEKRGDFVRLVNEPGCPPPRDRFGQPHDLPVCRDCFRTFVHVGAGVRTLVPWKSMHFCLECAGWHDSLLFIRVEWMPFLGDIGSCRQREELGGHHPRHAGINRRAAAEHQRIADFCYIPIEFNLAHDPSRRSSGFDAQ
jgi:hypothetical protein